MGTLKEGDTARVPSTLESHPRMRQNCITSGFPIPLS